MSCARVVHSKLRNASAISVISLGSTVAKPPAQVSIGSTIIRRRRVLRSRLRVATPMSRILRLTAWMQKSLRVGLALPSSGTRSPKSDRVSSSS